MSIGKQKTVLSLSAPVLFYLSLSELKQEMPIAMTNMLQYIINDVTTSLSSNYHIQRRA